MEDLRSGSKSVGKNRFQERKKQESPRRYKREGELDQGRRRFGEKYNQNGPLTAV